ncbi:MAG: hypothetical protein ACI87A_001874, partial [Planctomycetota bacterium]
MKLSHLRSLLVLTPVCGLVALVQTGLAAPQGGSPLP